MREILSKSLPLYAALLIFGIAASCKRGPKIGACMLDREHAVCSDEQVVPFDRVDMYECAHPDDLFYVFSDCKSGKGWTEVVWCEFHAKSLTLVCTDKKEKTLLEVQQWGCVNKRDKYRMKLWCERRE